MMALTKIYISPTDELEKSTLCFFDVAIEEKMIQKNVVFFFLLQCQVNYVPV